MRFTSAVVSTIALSIGMGAIDFNDNKITFVNGFSINQPATKTTIQQSSQRTMLYSPSSSKLWSSTTDDSETSAPPTTTTSTSTIIKDDDVFVTAANKVDNQINVEIPTKTIPFAVSVPEEEQQQSPVPRQQQQQPSFDTKGMTERIMKRIQPEEQATGAGGSSTYDAFLRAEENWTRLKEFVPFAYNSDTSLGIDPVSGVASPPKPFVTSDGSQGNTKCWSKLRQQNLENKQLDYDVVVCGGTLGIFFATALQLKGHRVAVIEAGQLRGREQEWNISYNELMELVHAGVLTEQDINDAIQTEFPACRSGFKNKEVSPLTNGGYFDNNIGYECITPDVLNLGVSPTILLERAGKKFVELGGVIKQQTRLNGIVVSDLVGTALDISDNTDNTETTEPITTRLVIDCMGNGSPISRQQRYGLKPDGVCAVVGSCASGYDAKSNTVGDIIYTFDTIQDKERNGQLQYFWEAFPVGIGRNGIQPGSSNTKTTYMFTYMDANQMRPSLETLMEDYWKLLPIYQSSINNPEIDLDFKRILFAYFPTYTDSPVKPQFSRILAVGDASGIQSPLSFGGLGALTRHLSRITTAVDEALQHNLLHKSDLGLINAYTPNLSAAWMFQKAMSIQIGQSNVDEKFVNRLLAVNFEVMNNMGQRTIKPFLQDVIRFDGLVGSLAGSFVKDPTFMPQIIAHVGIPKLINWLGHVSMMGTYSILDTYASTLVKTYIDTIQKNNVKEQFIWRRRMDAWKFGSGNDYILPDEN